MSQFTTELVVEQIGDSKYYRLLEGFEYHVGEYPSNEVIVVPKGFITDFASSPKILWPILPPRGEYGKAAVIHDYCYFIVFWISIFIAVLGLGCAKYSTDPDSKS